MLYVINAEFGGFTVPEEVREVLKCDEDGFGYDKDIRTNETLIEWVCAHRDDDENDLALVNIPEESTDWEMDEYDGFESILAVVNGKIIHLESWDGVE